MFLVVGLGNPGLEYADNRHNIGFMVVDRLALRWSAASWKMKFGGEHARGEAFGQPIILLKPMEFMNASGPPTRRTTAFFQVEPRNTIVVHDEIDLEFGRIKVKVAGGHGGHNGLRSVGEHLGPAFIRVRCGVGHPGNKGRVVGHVLGAFDKSEAKELPLFIEKAADAVECILAKGVSVAMNEFNTGPAQ